MIMIREFVSNFTKIKRTPMLILHLLAPLLITGAFMHYYADAGYHIIPDVRSFFILLQIGQPIFISITVPLLIQLDRKINGIQNALGLVESRRSVYMGKLLFLLSLSAISMILYEICFFIGTDWLLDISIMDPGSYLAVSGIFLSSSLLLYILHIWIALRFGAGISVLTGISGTILAGLFENPIGDKIWQVLPWEWGIRFLKDYFQFSKESVLPGILSLIIMTLMAFGLSTLWFDRWEGNIVQE